MGFSPRGQRRGLKASCVDSGRGPEGPLFHGGAEVRGGAHGEMVMKKDREGRVRGIPRFQPQHTRIGRAGGPENRETWGGRATRP